jgi:hypothetical protein
MSVDYKAMSRDKAIDAIDLLPGFAFWREGCRTFAKNVVRVMQAADGDSPVRDVLSFVRSLPLDPSYLSKPEWQAGFCYQCLKKAFMNTPEAQSREFQETVMDYFLYYFPDRDRIAKWMLIDAFVGFIIGIDEAG